MRHAAMQSRVLTAAHPCAAMHAWENASCRSLRSTASLQHAASSISPPLRHKPSSLQARNPLDRWHVNIFSHSCACAAHAASSILKSNSPAWQNIFCRGTASVATHSSSAVTCPFVNRPACAGRRRISSISNILNIQYPQYPISSISNILDIQYPQ